MIPPHYDADAWQSIIVAGTRSPGTVSLSGHVRKVDWDVQKADGEKGATMSRKARPPGAFDAEFYLVTDDDFMDWDGFQTLLEQATMTDPPTGLDVVHPDLQRQGFTSVVLGSIGEMKLDGRGGAKVKCHFLEHLPPTPEEPAGASGSKSGSGGGKKAKSDKDGSSYDPNDPIAVATNELNEALAEGDSL